MRALVACLSGVLSVILLTAVCVKTRGSAIEAAFAKDEAPRAHEASFALYLGEDSVIMLGVFADEPTRQVTLDAVRVAFPDRRLDDRSRLDQSLPHEAWPAELATWVALGTRVEHFELTVTDRVIRVSGVAEDARGKTKLIAATESVKSLTLIDALSVKPPGERAIRDLTGFFNMRTIEFEPTENTLSSAGERTVSDLAKVLKEQDPSLHFEIVGHTDAEGDHGVNVRISQRRALSVKNALGKFGVSTSILVTRGAGPDQPIASNQTAEGRRRNRRIEVRPLKPAEVRQPAREGEGTP
jgi:OmpA-OmpF porin, OOP family